MERPYESSILKGGHYITIQDQNPLPQKENEQNKYTYNNQYLVKYYFWWTLLIFLIDNYYVNECTFWLIFRNYYQYVMSDLIPLNVIFLLIYATNIVFQIMMTSKYQKNPFISQNKNFRQMIRYYFRYEYNGLLAIVYVIFLLSFMVPYQPASYLHNLILLRLIAIKIFLKKFYFRIYQNDFLRIGFNLTIIFYVLLFLSHILGSIFYIIDTKLIENQYFGDPIQYPDHYYQFSSQSFNPIYSLSDLGKYIYAYYFSSALVSTIAYGDVVGKNWIESCYTLFLLILSTITVAFLLEEFMTILGDYKFQIFQIIHRFKSLKELMKQKKIPQQLQIKIRNSLLYSQYYDKFYNSSQVFDKLSERLKNDIRQQAYSPIFSEILTPLNITNLRDICNCIEEVTYQPQTDVYFPDWKTILKNNYQFRYDILQQEILRPKLILLLNGKFLQYVQWESSSQQFRIRQGEKIYNFYEFLTNTKVRFGLRSKSLVQVICLSQQNFDNILEQNPEQKKSLKEQKEMILSNSKPRDLFYDKCQICGQTDHNVLSCPDVHHVIDSNIERAHCLDNILSSFQNQRRSFNRKSKKSKKIYNVSHMFNIFDRLFGAMDIETKDQNQLKMEELPFVFLKTSINSMLDKVNYKKEEGDKEIIDSAYDHEGIDPAWGFQEQ